MSKPWENADGSIDCPVDDFKCTYFQGGKCTLKNVEELCSDFYYEWEDYVDPEPADIDNDCGFDPYMGCYTDDC